MYLYPDGVLLDPVPVVSAVKTLSADDTEVGRNFMQSPFAAPV